MSEPMDLHTSGSDRDQRLCLGCGHPMHAHELVKGFEPSPGVTVTNEDGTPCYTGDVWVCTGARLVEITEDTSPWDCVCGCILKPRDALTPATEQAHA